MSDPRLILFPQALQELKRQTAPSAFISVDGRGEDDHVGAEHLLHQSDGDRGGLVNDQELSLGQLSIVLRLNVLNRLPVILEDVNTNHGMVEVGVCRLEDVIVGVLSEVKRVQSLEQELEDSGQVLWAGRGDEDVAEAVCYSA